MNIILFKGQEVTPDADKANRSTVTVIKQTPNRFYTVVSNGESSWIVMTYHLTLIK